MLGPSEIKTVPAGGELCLESGAGVNFFGLVITDLQFTAAMNVARAYPGRADLIAKALEFKDLALALAALMSDAGRLK